MLDDGNGFERRKPVRRTAEERAAIVAESYEWARGLPLLRVAMGLGMVRRL